MLFNQIAFQNKRFQLRIRHNVFKAPDMGHHLFNLYSLVPTALKILPHPVFQADRFPDIDDIILLIMHNINPGTSGEFF